MNIYEKIKMNLKLFHSLRYVGLDLEATEPILLEDGKPLLELLDNIDDNTIYTIEMGGVG